MNGNRGFGGGNPHVGFFLRKNSDHMSEFFTATPEQISV